METYWISFRIADLNTTKGDYDARYQALVDAINGITPERWWVETTAFIVFRTALSVDQIVDVVKAAIAANFDIVLIGMTDFKTMRLVGAAQDAATLLALVPFMKKV